MTASPAQLFNIFLGIGIDLDHRRRILSRGFRMGLTMSLFLVAMFLLVPILLAVTVVILPLASLEGLENGKATAPQWRKRN